MATVYLNDDVLMKYAQEHGGVKEAKEHIKEMVAENAPEVGE